MVHNGDKNKLPFLKIVTRKLKSVIFSEVAQSQNFRINWGIIWGRFMSLEWYNCLKAPMGVISNVATSKPPICLEVWDSYGYVNFIWTYPNVIAISGNWPLI